MRASRKSFDGDEQVNSLIDISKHGPLAEVYKNVRQEFEKTTRHGSFDKLWEKISPSGNIYRYLGFQSERLRHCKDLTQQVMQVAGELPDEVLPGKTKEKKAENLVKELKNVKQYNVPQTKQERQDKKKGLKMDPDAEAGNPEGDFLPLTEFLDEKFTSPSGLGIVLPGTSEEWGDWRRNHLMGFMVATIQIAAPILIIIHCWYGENNPLKEQGKPFDFEKVKGMFTVKEAMCLNKDSHISAQLTTIMGTMMLIIVNTIILSYAKDEMENASKLGKLPLDNFWSIVSTVANGACCLFISFAIPLEFWNEEGPTGIIMNAMALLFIFTFDDLTGDAFAYLGEDDGSFQRAVSWHYALLAHCPVQLKDIMNPDAKSASEIFSIRFNDRGRMKHTGHPLALKAPDSDEGILLTRVSPMAADEKTPLNPKTKEEEDDDEEEDLLPPTRYQVVNGGSEYYLPGWRSTLLVSIWAVIVFLLNVVWWVIPPIWFIINKPCTLDNDMAE